MKEEAENITCRMEYIMRVFRHAQKVCDNDTDRKFIFSRLDEIEKTFRSVAYESASMWIAQHELDKSHGLQKWNQFQTPTPKAALL